MKNPLSERVQVILIWWALITMVIFGACLWTLLHMVPPPSPQLPAAQIAEFYRQNSSQILVGAMITSWTSAFMVPLAVAISAQMWRLEKGVPVCSIAQIIGGATMSMFLVFPPIIWGVAAFAPDRAPEITAMLHQAGALVLVTTDQYYMFQLFAIIYFSWTHEQDELSPFPRWMGWLTLWAGLIYEVGPIGFMFKHGPFAWNGLFVFWFPFVTFGLWITVMSVMLLRSIGRQRAALSGSASATGRADPAVAIGTRPVTP
ncbi:MAG TPA: hypothetical protein VJQ47_04555 [Steroidobacteraceae bacterium]|nr:hypothetical protein [Steroidobacteraceae bacterium]